MASELHGGKTSPRLLEDLRFYNPQRLPNSQFNVLISLPQPYNGKTPARKIGKGACQHDWKLKPNQCSNIDVGIDPNGDPRQVAAFCAKCRCHLRLRLSFAALGWTPRPCPQKDAPLHHFKYSFAESDGFRRSHVEGEDERWEAHEKFRCTLEHCEAELDVNITSPRLTSEFVDLLTDKSLIEQRAMAAITSDPARFEGVAIPLPIHVLSNLRAYLTNSLVQPDGPQKINSQNKRFLLGLGESCAGLLEYLTFEREGDYWIPPRPAYDQPAPLENATNILLDDVLKEILVIMSVQEEQERRVLRGDYPMTAATRDLYALLGCLDYETNPATRRLDLTDEDEHPFYAGLGSVINFHDRLLIFAYDQQQLTDPANSPYYLQCLQGIAKGRGSEDLQTKAAIEESSGRVSLDDIRSAYNALGFDPSMPVDEETVIGTFKSRVTDAPRQEEDLRRCLRIIGANMNSRRIEDFAADAVHTYEQALNWLGATAEMGDDFITSMYSLKINENPNNEKMANHCVLLIANHRNSDSLRGWLSTGILHPSEMEPAAALEYLVPGNPDAEDDFVLSCYTAALNDTPSQKPDLDRALRAIAKHRNSPLLLSMSGGAANDRPAVTHNLAEWPIGLENIGNTCYLNSLLQFFFTIKPLRSLVLNNGEYLMDINPSTLQRKKVGSRQVTRREILRAQQFIKELSTLFQEMITTPKAQITPKLELARLTMLSTATEETLRRASVLSDAKPNLAGLQTEAGRGNLTLADDAVLVDSPLQETKRGGPSVGTATSTSTQEIDTSSETTLVEPPADDRMDVDPRTTQVPVHEDKENISPTKIKFDRPQTPDHNLKPLAETSPSRVNQDTGDSVAKAAAATAEQMEVGETITLAAPPPTRTPPIPPRTNSERRTTINEEELYRQQDVTEVIGNVLFQLQCAIKPDELDESGEQIDLIKRLFYGRMKTTTTDAAGKPRTMEEFFSDLKINVSSGPPDLYSALDSLFDRRMVELGSSDQQHEEAQFSTITALPAVLQIHPIRTAFDRQRGAYKVNHQFAFDEVIYLDRYMDGGDAQTQQKRAKCWEMKDQLKRIEERHIELGKNALGLTARQTLLCTAEYLKQIEAVGGAELLPGVSPTLIEKVRQAADDVKDELAAMSVDEEAVRTNLRAAWADPSFQTIPYRLHAVFIHRGMVSSGHYWVYIFDHPRRLWRKYNDGYVTEVDDPATEIFGKQPGDRPATPMFFVYVKEAQEVELVEVVRRELPPQASTPVDSEMAEAPKRSATEKVPGMGDGNGMMDGQAEDEQGGGVLGKGLTCFQYGTMFAGGWPRMGLGRSSESGSMVCEDSGSEEYESQESEIEESMTEEYGSNEGENGGGSEESACNAFKRAFPMLGALSVHQNGSSTIPNPSSREPSPGTGGPNITSRDRDANSSPQHPGSGDINASIHDLNASIRHLTTGSDINNDGSSTSAGGDSDAIMSDSCDLEGSEDEAARAQALLMACANDYFDGPFKSSTPSSKNSVSGRSARLPRKIVVDTPRGRSMTLWKPGQRKSAASVLGKKSTAMVSSRKSTSVRFRMAATSHSPRRHRDALSPSLRKSALSSSSQSPVRCPPTPHIRLASPASTSPERSSTGSVIVLAPPRKPRGRPRKAQLRRRLRKSRGRMFPALIPCEKTPVASLPPTTEDHEAVFEGTTEEAVSIMVDEMEKAGQPELEETETRSEYKATTVSAKSMKLAEESQREGEGETCHPYSLRNTPKRAAFRQRHSSQNPGSRRLSSE